ncbi:hypothetical protein L873DRAFT_224531 [Choiromyces venosus 120613-1]|uniref:Uncharacterized protein n=1 Tax=Choiromyces venosus 120613-1 TaxID=1336337 RepID=A0A3N4K256_9PEZI|nr:hypothetical protein L873DRAFT_224531 [Choiromyces venosus 120613-1]
MIKGMLYCTAMSCLYCTVRIYAWFTVKTGIIGPHARTLELPFLVRSAVFFFLSVSVEGRKRVFLAVFFSP